MLGLPLTIACPCHAQGTRSGREDSAARSAMAEALREAPSSSGSLEYSGDCDTQPPPILPRVRTLSEGRGRPALVMLREIFADDSRMQVTQESDGTIRMVENNVQQDLLEVMISKISFKDAYDPVSAHALILSEPEVRAFMKSHAINSHEGRFRSQVRGLHIEPQPGLPHMSEDLENVSVRQAMDRLLRTFPGFWIYENCQSENRGRVVAFDYLQSLALPNP